MASDVMTLFNMPTQQQLGQRYLESQMTSPAQMGNQGLLQQVASLGGNAGAIAGYAGGRLFGGATPEQIRAKGIEESMMKVQGLGLTSDAEMYAALSKELASRGLTQDAFMANKEARTAMRDEQVLKKGGVDIQLGNAQLKKLEQDMLGLEEQLGIALSQGKEDKVNDLRRQINEKKLEAQAKQAEIDYKTKMGNAALMNAEANKERAGAAAGAESYNKAEMERDPILGTPRVIGRYSAKLNQYLSNDGMSVFKSRAELLEHDNALRGQAKPPADNTPKNKQPLGNISEFLGAPVTPGPTPWAAM